MANTAQEALEAVTGFEYCEPVGVIERYTAWASGRADEAMAYSIARANWQCSDKIAGTLFDLHVMCEHAYSLQHKMRQVKDWGYTVAASYASSGRQKYRLDWGRQATRDGLYWALWGEHDVPSADSRAAVFGIGRRKYLLTRQHVREEARGLIDEFHGFLKNEANPQGRF